ncbi:hypothetical protein GCM10010269_46990 [Streptomyces humidus]|uniref:Transposase IS110-like N-terminal domain-containing protein n=1 Tax=Streptomyces humidus TaxID=52259 RepID=A0A918FYG3_9ACTN|nr:hypothetical protein GCM10010269_46990 [Streptomyces humidus]
MWARKRGTVRRAGVEGTGTFGAGLSRYLLAQQVEVYEVNRPDRSARRLLGKSDPLDAQAAARAVLSGRARARAKSGDGPVRSARMLKLGKDSAVKARTQAINQLKAVLVIADPALREQLSSLGNRELFRTCARLGLPGGGGDEDAVTQATHLTLRMLAERIEQLTGQIDELNQRLTQLVSLPPPAAGRDACGGTARSRMKAAAPVARQGRNDRSTAGLIRTSAGSSAELVIVHRRNSAWRTGGCTAAPPRPRRAAVLGSLPVMVADGPAPTRQAVSPVGAPGIGSHASATERFPHQAGRNCRQSRIPDGRLEASDICTLRSKNRLARCRAASRTGSISP